MMPFVSSRRRLESRVHSSCRQLQHPPTGLRELLFLSGFEALSHRTPLLLRVASHSGDVNSVRWNPTDPGVLASAGDDGHVRLWKYAN